MTLYQQIALYYLLAVNLLTFVTYGIDKWKARHGRWRVPEAILLLFAAIGGSPAALLAMHLFRHKTHHKKFRYGVHGILVAQVLLVVLVNKYL